MLYDVKSRPIKRAAPSLRRRLQLPADATEERQQLFEKVAEEIFHADRELFDALSTAERNIVLDWLASALIEGDTKNAIHDILWELDYRRKPVGIEEFIESEDYLGRITQDLHDNWKNDLSTVFAPGSQIFEWIFCLSGDTRIPLLDGTESTLKELHDRFQSHPESFWVYSVDAQGDVKPGKCTRVTKFKPDRLFRITFDDGSTVRANADHEFVCRDGVKRKVRDLKAGSRLMPFNTTTRQMRGQNRQCYETVYLPGSQKYAYTHRVVGAALCGGVCPVVWDGDRAVLHHKDFDCRNNTPENLKWMGWAEHRAGHCFQKSPEFLCMLAERQSLACRDPNSPIRRGHKRFMQSSAGRMLSRRNLAKAEVSLEQRREYLRRASQARWADPEQRRVAAIRCAERSRGNTWGCDRTTNRRDVSVDDLFASYAVTGNLSTTYADLAISRNAVVRILRDAELTIKDLKAGYQNHRIVSIESAGVESVYCLTVPEYENFAICTGDGRRGVFSGNTGSVGCGKTTVAMAALAFKLHCLSCMHNPAEYYGLLPDSLIIFGIYSITKKQVADTGYFRFKGYVDTSPYFVSEFPRSTKIDSKMDFKPTTGMNLQVIPGCVAEGTPVETPDGSVPIEELAQRSKQVLTWDGEHVYASPFSGVKFSGVKRCLDISVATGHTLRCSHDHKILVRRGNYNVWKRAEEVKIGEEVFVMSGVEDAGSILPISEWETAGTVQGVREGAGQCTLSSDQNLQRQKESSARPTKAMSAVWRDEVPRAIFRQDGRVGFWRKAVFRLSLQGMRVAEGTGASSRQLGSKKSVRIFAQITEAWGSFRSVQRRCANRFRILRREMRILLDRFGRGLQSRSHCAFCGAWSDYCGEYSGLLPDMQQTEEQKAAGCVSATMAQGNLGSSHGEDHRVCAARIVSITDAGEYRTYDVIEVPHTHTVITSGISSSNSRELHALGLDLYAFSLDECNFMQERQDKERGRVTGQAYQLYNATYARILSRFIRPGGTIPGIMILMSSRNAQTSFLEEHIKRVQGSKHTYISDYALWEAKDASKYVLPWFKVEVGDRLSQSRILVEGEESRPDAHIIKVPGEYRKPFEEDTDQALRDVAGVATFNISPLIRDRQSIFDAYRDHLEHPFKRRDITVSLADDVQIAEYFEMRKFCRVRGGRWVPKINPAAPRCIHIDTSLTGDCTGIAMAHMSGMVRHERVLPDGTKVVQTNPFIIVDFMLRVLPPQGSEIELAKVRTFIKYLRNEVGLNLCRISLDGYQCFTGDTEISLLDGTTRMMKELAERYGRREPFWVYSYDQRSGRIVPGCARNARRTGRRQLCSVRLDNGAVVRCTFDHRWLLRDGSYRRAIDLCEGDSLMPLYRRMSERGRDSVSDYEMVMHPRGHGKKWQYTHRMVARAVHGKGQIGMVVHHRDFNARNNTPANLEWQDAQQHLDFHRALGHQKAGFDRLGYWTPERRAQQAEMARKLHIDPEFYRRNCKHLAQVRGLIRYKTPHKTAVNRALAIRRNVAGARAPRRLKHITAAVVLESALRCPGLTQRELGVRLGVCQDVVAARLDELGVGRARGWRHRLLSAVENHRVISVEVLDVWEDVYDLEVDTYSNFALAAGVIVHNSSDTRQILERERFKAVIQSIDRDEDPYVSLRTAYFERRIATYAHEDITPNVPGYETELFDLQRISRQSQQAGIRKWRIDHPVRSSKGGKASKDISDAVCGAVFGCLTDEAALYTPPELDMRTSGARATAKIVDPTRQRMKEVQEQQQAKVRTADGRELDWEKLRKELQS